MYLSNSVIPLEDIKKDHLKTDKNSNEEEMYGQTAGAKEHRDKPGASSYQGETLESSEVM
jgi:hypothetical protein